MISYKLTMQWKLLIIILTSNVQHNIWGNTYWLRLKINKQILKGPQQIVNIHIKRVSKKIFNFQFKNPQERCKILIPHGLYGRRAPQVKLYKFYLVFVDDSSQRFYPISIDKYIKLCQVTFSVPRNQNKINSGLIHVSSLPQQILVCLTNMQI